MKTFGNDADFQPVGLALGSKKSNLLYMTALGWYLPPSSKIVTNTVVTIQQQNFRKKIESGVIQ